MDFLYIGGTACAFPPAVSRTIRMFTYDYSPIYPRGQKKTVMPYNSNRLLDGRRPSGDGQR